MSTDTGELFELEEEPRPSASAEPRPAALATWIARVIVVLTLGLLTLVGGLFLGLSVWDTPSSATPMSTTMPTTPQTSLSGTPIPTETDAAATQAPSVRISSVAPGGSTSASGSRSAGQSLPSGTVVTTSPQATSSPSPSPTSTPRGRGQTKPPKPR